MATNSVPNANQLTVLSVSKVQTTSESIQSILEACKSFFTHENRQKVSKLCELEDLSKSSHIPLMTFGRILRYMNFRLLFEEIKKFVYLINIYQVSKDRLYYAKLTSSVLRKLFKPPPFLFFMRPSQHQAASKIQKFYLAKKNMWIRPGVRHPSVIMKELARRLHEINKPLLKCFEQAEKNRCGYLEIVDLDGIIKAHGIETNFEETREVFRVIDKRQVGKVNYDNFITAFEGFFFAISRMDSQAPVSLQVKKTVNFVREMFKYTGLNCLQCFRMFDLGDIGVIPFDHFFEILSKIGFNLSQIEVRQVFDYVDTGKDNYLSFIEFAAAFFDINESPIEILRRLEIEEQIRKEEEAKRLEEEERLRVLQEEENKKKQEEEEALKKLNEEAKGKKGKKGGKGGSKGGKKEGKAKTGKGESGKKEGKAGKKGGKAGKGGKAKTGKVEEPPPEPVIDENEIRLQELREYMKKEFFEPILSTAFVQAEYMMLAKAGQHKLENRPVDKYCYTHNLDWSVPTQSPMCTTLYISPDLSQTGYLDQSGILKTHNLISGAETSVMHLGTKPPFEKIPIIGGACDSNLGRIYILNKQWVLEIWNLHEKNTAPIKRVKVLSKVVGHDYIQKYSNEHYLFSPKLLTLAQNGVIIVNSTCADGFIYCFEPISLTLLWRSRLTLDELKLPRPVLSAYEDFETFIQACIKSGKTEKQLYDLLNPNKSGKVTLTDFNQVLQTEKLALKDSVLKNLFKVLDPKNLGFIYLDKLFTGMYFKDLEFLKTDLDSSKLLPDWVNNLHANESIKDAMYRIFVVMEKKSLKPSQIVEKIKTLPELLPDDEYVPNEYFQEVLNNFLAPEVNAEDLRTVIGAEDRENTGKVNFFNLLGNLTSKKLAPSTLLQLNSQKLPRDSLKYVLHKSIELGVDLYKKCKDLDTSASGTLPKEVFASILLLMPIGLDIETLQVIFDRDLTFNSIGNIDYLEIFERQEYFQLLVSSKKTEFLTPPLQEEAAVIQDFAFMPELSLIAFASINPATSTIFLKDLNGNLISKLVGHFSTQPPILHYCSNSSTLISGETRLSEQDASPFNVTLPPSEIFLWNIQKDLIEKFKYNPPWIIKPYRRVHAHIGSVQSLNYLPLTQVVVSTGSDNKLKLWSVTGIPFTLLEQEYIPLSDRVVSQYTQSNQMLTCVRCVDCEDCSNVVVGKNNEKEWLVCVCGKANEFNVKCFAFGRFKIKVPARQHDWEIPEWVEKKVSEIFCGMREKGLEGFQEKVQEKLDGVMKMVELLKNYEKVVQKKVVRAIVFNDFFDDLIQCVQEYPNRKPGMPTTPAELYNVLVKYAGFHSITFPKFLFLLSDIQEKCFGRKITNKDEAALVSLTRILEESTDLSQLSTQIFTHIHQCLTSQNKSASETLSKLDQNQDKVLNIEEFSEFFKSININLRKTELISLMKLLDSQNSTTVNTQNLQKKLEDCGYADPFFTNYYEYVWEDRAVGQFIKKFKKQHKFRNFFEFFSYFDGNNDGFLNAAELFEGVRYVDRKRAERISNILNTSLNSSLSCRALGDLLESSSNKLQELNKSETSYEAMAICIKQYNALEETKNSVSALLSTSSTILKNLNTGLEIHSRKYRLSQGLHLLKSAKIVFQETIDRVLVTATDRMNQKILSNYPKTDSIYSGFATEYAEIKNFSVEDLQIVWDKDQEIKEGEGKILQTGENIIAVAYSQDVLNEEVQGVGKYGEVIMKEVQVNAKLQKLCPSILKVVGICRVHCENSGGLWVLYEKPLSKSLKSVLETNGGVLSIPITHKLSAGKVILIHWSREILKILLFLQEQSVVLPYFSADFLYFSEGFFDFKVRLQHLSFLDSAGRINSLSRPLKSFENLNYDLENSLAPEFYTSQTQGVSLQVWNFASTVLNLAFGEKLAGFSQAYSHKTDQKGVKTQLKTGLEVSKTFFYNPSAYLEIQNGKVQKNKSYELGALKSLACQSYSGLISHYKSTKNELVQLDDLKTEVKTETCQKTDPIGEIFDLISVCFSIDPEARPSLQSVLQSGLFQLTQAEESQSRKFAKIVFQHKNPSLVITRVISQKVAEVEKDPVGRADDTIELILNLNLTLLSYDDLVLKDTIEAVNAFNVPEAERQEMISKNLVFPATELLNQCIEDQVFERIAKVSVLFAQKNEMKVIENFGNLLKSLMEYLNSVKVPVIKHCFCIFKAFMIIYTGNFQVFTDEYSALEICYWKPEIYYLLCPIFKEFFGENGQVAKKLPGLEVVVRSKVHAGYLVEINQIFENLTVLKNPESIIYQKLAALKSLKDAVVSNNEHRLKAARDSKFMQFIINFLQDDDQKIRSECLDIFFALSSAAKENFLSEIPELSPDHNSKSLTDYLLITSQDDSEGKSYTGCCLIVKYLKDLSECFQSALFIYPIVRLMKLRSETSENKETGLKLLVNLLQGNEYTQQACLSPFTDTLSTICSTLTSFNKTSEAKSGKNLGDIMLKAVEDFLSTASPTMLKAFRLSPGSDIVFKELTIRIPDSITLSTLLARTSSPFSLEDSYTQFLHDLKNYLKLPNTDQTDTKSKVFSCFQYLQTCSNRIWDHLEGSFTRGKSSVSSEQKKLFKGKLKEIFSFFEYCVMNEIDLQWLEEIDNIEWVVEKSLKSIEHSGSDYDSFPFGEEGKICLRILARVIKRPGVDEVFEKLVFGKVFVLHFRNQFQQLKEMMMKNHDALEVLEFDREMRQVRMSVFECLVRVPGLVEQVVEHGICEILVRDLLPDRKQLNVEVNEFVSEFIPQSELFPIRHEALKFSKKILKLQDQNPKLFTTFLETLKTHKSLQTELRNMQDQNSSLSISSTHFLHRLLSISESPISQLLSECEGSKSLKPALSQTPWLRDKFPGLSNYLSRLS